MQKVSGLLIALLLLVPTIASAGLIYSSTPTTSPVRGTISPAGYVYATSTGTTAFTVVPRAGYSIGNVTLDGVSLAATGLSGGGKTYSVPNKAATQKIVAGFVAASTPVLDAKLTNSLSIAAGSPLIITGGASTISLPNNVLNASYTWSVSPAGPTLSKTSGVTESSAGLNTTFTSAATGVYSVTLTLSAPGMTSSSATTTVVIQTAAIAQSKVCTDCHSGAQYSDYAGSLHANNPYVAVSCQQCHNPGLALPHPGIAKGSPLKGVCLPCHLQSQAFANNTAHFRQGKTYWSYTNMNTCVDCHDKHLAVGSSSLYTTYAESGHANYRSGAWNHNTTVTGNEVTMGARNCGRCHNMVSFLSFVGYSSNGAKSAAAPFTTVKGLPSTTDNKTILACRGCHTDARGTIRPIGAVSVYYNYTASNANANGVKATLRASEFSYLKHTYPDSGPSNACISCHTGRQSGETIKALGEKNGANVNSFKTTISTHDFPMGIDVYANLYNVTPFTPPQKAHESIGMANYNNTGTTGPCVGCHSFTSTDHSQGAVVLNSDLTVASIKKPALCANCHGASLDATALNTAKWNYKNSLAVLAQVLLNKGYMGITSGSAPNLTFTAAATFTYGSALNINYFRGPAGWGAGQLGVDRLGVAMNLDQFSNRDKGGYAHNPSYARKTIYDAIDLMDDGIMNGSATNTVRTITLSGIIGLPSGLDLDGVKISAINYVVQDRASCDTCHRTTVDPLTSQNIVDTYNASGHSENSHGPSCVSCHAPTSGTLSHPVAPMLNTGAAITTKCEGCHKGSPYFGATAAIRHWGNAYNLAFYTNRNQCNDCHNAHDPVSNFDPGVYRSFANSGHANTVTSVDPANPTVPRGQFRRQNSVPAGATIADTANAATQRTRQCSLCHLEDGIITYVESGYTTYYTGVTPTNDSIIGCKSCHTNAIGTMRPTPAAKAYYNYSGRLFAGTPNKKWMPAPVTYPDARSSNVCVICHSGGGDLVITPQAVTMMEAAMVNLSSATSAPNNHQMIAAQSLYGVGYNKNIGTPTPNRHQTINMAGGAGKTSGPCAGCHNLNHTEHSWKVIDDNGFVTNEDTCSTCHGGHFNVEAGRVKFNNNLLLTVQVLRNAGRMVTYSSSLGRPSLKFTGMSGKYGVGGKLYGEMLNLSMVNNDGGAFAHNPPYYAQINKSAIQVTTGISALDAVNALTAITVPQGSGTATLQGGVTLDQAKSDLIASFSLGDRHFSASTPYKVQYNLETNSCQTCHNPSESTVQADARAAWAESGHGETVALPWIPSASHEWRASGSTANFATNVPASDCVRCHTADGFAQFVGGATPFSNVNNLVAPGSANAKINSPLACNTCHTSPIDATSSRLVVPQVTTYYNVSSAGVKSHIAATYPAGLGETNICIPCHSGRLSGANLVAVKDQLNFANSGFQNSHYMAAAGLMYAKVGFTAFTTATAPTGVASTGTYGASMTSNEDGGKLTSTHRKLGTTAIRGDSHNPAFFVAGNLDSNGPCVTCHLKGYKNTPSPRFGAGHTLAIDQSAWDDVCTNCHATEGLNLVEETEGEYQDAIKYAIQLLQTKLPIEYDSSTYPYFYKAGLPHTSANAYKNWSNGGSKMQGLRNEGAAFNINLLSREPFAYVHARTYTRRLLYDTIDYLDDGIVNMSVSATLQAAPFNLVKGAYATDPTGNRIFPYLGSYNRTTGAWQSPERP
jgi:Cytochrome c554 and c-prime